MPYKKSTPILGDDSKEGTVFPITRDVDPMILMGVERADPDNAARNVDDARLMPVVNVGYALNMARQHPDRYAQMKQIRADVIKLMANGKGGNLSDFAGRSTNPRLVSKVRANIVKAHSDLDVNQTEVLNRLKGFGVDANEFIDYVTATFFPGYTTLEPANEIRSCNDPAKLLLIALDDNWALKARFEAKRKLDLMQRFMERKKALKPIKGRMDAFYELLNTHMLDATGVKRGSHEKGFLIATLDPENGNSCLEARLDTMPLFKAEENQVSMPMELRAFEVRGRRIQFMVTGREKNKFSHIMKSMRKDETDITKLIKDLHGVRLVFLSDEDRVLFRRTFARRLRSAGFEVSSNTATFVGDGSKLPGIETELLISKPGFGRASYEMQAYTAEEYVDYFLKTPTAWPMYDIQRFYEYLLDEILFPYSIYDTLTKNQRHEIAYQAWQGAYDTFIRSLRVHHANGESSLHLNFFRQLDDLLTTLGAGHQG